MKVIKQVTTTGTINHRGAYFKASLCKESKHRLAIVFAITIQNPEDKISDLPKVTNILDGRISKRFNDGRGRRLLLYTESIYVSSNEQYLYSKETMEAMLAQFKRIKERDLADQLGLKWNPQEGEVVRELSIETPTSAEHV